MHFGGQRLRTCLPRDRHFTHGGDNALVFAERLGAYSQHTRLESLQLTAAHEASL